jgi:hypothetical protein
MTVNKWMVVEAVALALAGGLLAGSAMAAETGRTSGVQAPLARPATDHRSAHYRLRDKCAKQAQDQGLQGDDYKVALQLCLQGK